MRSRPWALALALLGTWACEAPGTQSVTVTDSAGVRITLSIDTSRVFADIDTTPLLSLGGADATGPTQFGNVRGVLLDARGRLWVADGQSAEIRLFRADGTFWKRVGGRGEGPGEFVSVRLLGSFLGDSVAVWDDALGRLTVLNPAGEVARTVSGVEGDTPPPNAFRVFHDGTVLARIREVLPAGALEPGTVIPDTAVLARVDYESGEVRVLGGAPAPRWLWTGERTVPIPFLLNPGFDVEGEAVHVTSGPAFRIRVLGNSGLVESYGLDRPPAPVTAREREEYRALFLGAGDFPGRDDYLSALEHPDVPQLLPAYRSLVVAADGHVWAERHEYGRFDVYGPDRVLKGRVEVPVALTQVTDSTLVGVWRDDLNVEHVRVYRFRRRGSGSG